MEDGERHSICQKYKSYALFILLNEFSKWKGYCCKYSLIILVCLYVADNRNKKKIRFLFKAFLK